MSRVNWRQGVGGLLLVIALGYVVTSAWSGAPVTGQSVLQLVLFSLPIAAVYAISAAGLVIVHSATGIFNFAQGSMGMICAFVFWELSVRRGMPVLLALVLVLGVFAPLMGVLLDKVLMRRLKDAPLAVQLVGTVGVLVALLGIATLIWNPNESYPLSGLGGEGGITIGGVMLTWHRVITIASAVVLAGAIFGLLRATTIGIAMRAVVDDEDVAALYGVHPGRVSSTAWVIGAVSAGLAGILIAPEVGNMSAETLSLLIVNAFAAAVFGRLRSLSMTYVGAILLGLVVTFSSSFLAFNGRWTSIHAAIPALCLFAVLLFLPQANVQLGRAIRSFHVETLPAWRTVVVWCSIFLVLAVVLGQVSNGVIAARLVTAVSLGIVLLGVVPVLGWAGIPFLAPLAFGGMGAAFTYWAGGGVAALLAAGIGTAVFAVLFALPALRLRDLYLALSSVALALITANLLLHQPEAFEVARSIAPPSLLGIRLDSPGNFLVYATVIYIVLAVGLVALRKSRVGRRLIALRDSAAGASSVGIDVGRQRALVFALGGFASGIGGGVLVQGAGLASVDQFSLIGGLSLILSLTVMGVGTASGPLVAAMMGMVFTTLAKDWAPGTLTHAIELFGPALAVLVLINAPRGQIPALTLVAKAHPARFICEFGGFGVGLAIGVVTDMPGFMPLIFAIAFAFVCAVVVGSVRSAFLAPEQGPPDALRDEGLGLDRPLTRTGVIAIDKALGVEGRLS